MKTEYRMEIEKDSNNEDCVIFYDSVDSDNDILTVRFHHLDRIDPEVRILDLPELEYKNVLTWVIRLASKIAAPALGQQPIEVIREFTTFIRDRYPNIDPDTYAETWLYIDKLSKLGVIAVKFKLDNPVTNFPNTTIEDWGSWRKAFVAYLRESNLL